MLHEKTIWRQKWPPTPSNGRRSITIDSNLMILMSIPRFWEARNTLRHVWISLSCWIFMKLNLWPSAVYYHLMHKHLCPEKKFQSVQFWASSSSSVSINNLSVDWIVIVFSLARAIYRCSAGESIASEAASRGIVSPQTVAIAHFQEFVRRSIVLGHN